MTTPESLPLLLHPDDVTIVQDDDNHTVGYLVARPILAGAQVAEVEWLYKGIRRIAGLHTETAIRTSLKELLETRMSDLDLAREFARLRRIEDAARAFIDVTRGGILEDNFYWTDLRDTLAAT